MQWRKDQLRPGILEPHAAMPRLRALCAVQDKSANVKKNRLDLQPRHQLFTWRERAESLTPPAWGILEVLIHCELRLALLLNRRDPLHQIRTSVALCLRIRLPP